MLYANQMVDLGHLSYVQSIWEYPPGRNGIIGGLCGLVFIIILIILCVQLKRRQRGPQTSRNGSSAQEQLDLVAQVKRWSRISPKRFSSFIPTGTMQSSSYSATSSDTHVTPFRGQSGLLRQHYPTYRDETEFF